MRSQCLLYYKGFRVDLGCVVFFGGQVLDGKTGWLAWSLCGGSTKLVALKKLLIISFGVN